MKKNIPYEHARTGFRICIINFQSKGDQIIYYQGETSSATLFNRTKIIHSFVVVKTTSRQRQQ